MRHVRHSLTLNGLGIIVALVTVAAAAQQPPIAPSALRSGVTFASADIQAMQADDATNPGLLWVERGAKLWDEQSGLSRTSCASCHGRAEVAMHRVAARYPIFDAAAGGVLDLEARINRCRTVRQQASELPRDSEDLLALTALVAFQARGVPTAVSIDGPARAAFERGRAFYTTRQGQMNLACTHCHDQNWGKRLLNETISQGHPNAFPAYRLEWQGLGSLQRRIRACLFGVRAQMPAPGAPELTDVELYLAWRANGLRLEAPGVRR